MNSFKKHIINSYYWSRLVSLIIALVSSFVGYAQTSDDYKSQIDSTFSSNFNMSIDDLLNLKISTGSFLNLDLQHSPMSLTVITKEQIELSGKNNLTEILEIYVPGFQYNVNKWNGLIWGMRGTAPDRNTNFVFLVNGHKMNHESRDGAMSELTLGLMDDIDRIEVLRGPGGLMYGSGAISGVINIVTLKDRGNSIHLSSKLQTWKLNSFGQEYQGHISREFSSNCSVNLSLGYRSSQGSGDSRLYGRPSWPYPQYLDNPPQNGVPTQGNAQSTPGNGKIAMDFTVGKLRVYSRLTHQVMNGSAWFVLDPWPEIVGRPGSTAPSKTVDGDLINYNSFLASTESFGLNRRQYVTNNISNQLNYSFSLGQDKIDLSAGFDAVTNRIQAEKIDGYEQIYGAEDGLDVFETFGERRYNIGLLYSYLGAKKLHFSSGLDFRVFDVGNDISGTNSQNHKEKHPIVSDVTYLYGSAFSEGVYHLNNQFDIHFGLRYDLHTRTLQHGGVLNPKIAVLYSPKANHTFKVIYQQSANNGSADSYEFNRNSFDDNGNPVESDDFHYENPFNVPRSSTPIIPPVNEEILHSLKPERSQSLEITGFHKFTDNVIALQSYSFNKISDLFAWNQSLFRIVNTGNYQFVNVDLEFQYNSRKITIGANHTYQRVVNMDVFSNNETVTMPVFEGWDSTTVNGMPYYTPKVVKNSEGNDSTITQIVNPITDGITVDGKNFINLNTNISKVYINYNLTNRFTIHTNCRVFWGLKGRSDIHNYNSTNTNPALDRFSDEFQNNRDYPYLDIHNKAMIKWDIGIIGKVKDQFTFAFHVYDILGNVGSRNSLRWQKSGIISEHTGLYSVDLRSYAVKVSYDF